MTIQTTLQFKTALRAGPYAWPGGYPMFFICLDGGALCHSCARKEARPIMQAIQKPGSASDWQVIAQEINWEDADMLCDHCNSRIESAYGGGLIHD